MKILVGIDGGGTKTKLVAGDLEGNILFEAEGGCSNICSVSEEIVRENIKNLFGKICCNIENPQYASICIGAAGVAAEENAEALYKMIFSLTGCGKIKVVNDGYIALFARFLERPGVSVTAGTGSICIGKNGGGDVVRSGGWGHLFSDEGGAYSIAIEGLRKAFDCIDKDERTELLDLFLKETGCSSIGELISYFYIENNDKKTIASYARVVDMAYDLGDVCAENVLQKAAEELMYLCNKVIFRLNIENLPFGIALNGGVFKNSHAVREKFIALVKKRYKNAQIVDETVDSAMGALYLAKKCM